MVYGGGESWFLRISGVDPPLYICRSQLLSVVVVFDVWW